MSDTQIRALCHALFDALERGDVAAVDRCYAPGMTMWFDVTGRDITRAENLEYFDTGRMSEFLPPRE